MTDTQLTHWKKLHNPDYLGSYSLQPEEEPILTIKEVVIEDVFDPRTNKKEPCPVLYFQEHSKPMVLNRTNSKTIEKIYQSPYIEDWPGKKIQLYSVKVNAFGEKVDALRIKPKVPVLELPHLTPNNAKWTHAIKSLLENKIDIAGVKKHFNLSADNEKKLLDEVAKCQNQDS